MFRYRYDCTSRTVGCQGPERPLVAVLAVSRLKLVELGIPLAGELPLRGFPVKFGTRTVVERSMKINPDLCVGVAPRLGSGRGIGQSQADQHTVPCRHVGSGIDTAMPWRRTSIGCAYRTS